MMPLDSVRIQFVLESLQMQMMQVIDEMFIERKKDLKALATQALNSIDIESIIMRELEAAARERIKQIAESTFRYGSYEVGEQLRKRLLEILKEDDKGESDEQES